MTDDEFERLKAAEKQHLREKKRMRKTLEALKRRNRAEGILQKMKHGAQRLLEETESLVDTLRSQVARNEAQLEVAIEENEQTDDLHEANEELRKERAESLIQQYKAAANAISRPATKEKEAPDGVSSSPDGPDKTIGRMRPRSDEEST